MLSFTHTISYTPNFFSKSFTALLFALLYTPSPLLTLNTEQHRCLLLIRLRYSPYRFIMTANEPFSFLLVFLFSWVLVLGYISGLRVTFREFLYLILSFHSFCLSLFTVFWGGIATRVLRPFWYYLRGLRFGFFSFVVLFSLSTVLGYDLYLWGHDGPVNVFSFCLVVFFGFFCMFYRVQRTPLIPQRFSFSEVGSTLFSFLPFAFFIYHTLRRQSFRNTPGRSFFGRFIQLRYVQFLVSVLRS